MDINEALFGILCQFCYVIVHTLFQKHLSDGFIEFSKRVYLEPPVIFIPLELNGNPYRRRLIQLEQFFAILCCF